MKISIRKGVGFGLTSGIITTLGLIVGLNSSTHSAFIVIGGILLIAIADALSDAMGIHVSEESAIKYSPEEIWEATFATFFSKLIFASTFIVPVLLLPLSLAMVVSVVWGMFLISVFSYYVATKEKEEPYKVVLEHLAITALVVVITHNLGVWIAATFG